MKPINYYNHLNALHETLEKITGRVFVYLPYWLSKNEQVNLEYLIKPEYSNELRVYSHMASVQGMDCVTYTIAKRIDPGIAHLKNKQVYLMESNTRANGSCVDNFIRYLPRLLSDEGPLWAATTNAEDHFDIKHLNHSTLGEMLVKLLNCAFHHVFPVEGYGESYEWLLRTVEQLKSKLKSANHYWLAKNYLVVFDYDIVYLKNEKTAELKVYKLYLEDEMKDFVTDIEAIVESSPGYNEFNPFFIDSCDICFNTLVRAIDNHDDEVAEIKPSIPFTHDSYYMTAVFVKDFTTVSYSLNNNQGEEVCFVERNKTRDNIGIIFPTLWDNVLKVLANGYPMSFLTYLVEKLTVDIEKEVGSWMEYNGYRLADSTIEYFNNPFIEIAGKDYDYHVKMIPSYITDISDVSELFYTGKITFNVKVVVTDKAGNIVGRHHLDKEGYPIGLKAEGLSDFLENLKKYIKTMDEQGMQIILKSNDGLTNPKSARIIGQYLKIVEMAGK